MKHFSKFGLVLVGLYVLLVTVVFSGLPSCGGEYCGLAALFATFPGFIIVVLTTPESFAVSTPGEVASVLITAAVVYFIGAGIGVVFRKIFIKKSKTPETI